MNKKAIKYAFKLNLNVYSTSTIFKFKYEREELHEKFLCYDFAIHSHEKQHFQVDKLKRIK